MNNMTMTNNNAPATFETSKTVRYSVSYLIKQIDNYEIKFDHPAQRESDQWNAKMKSNLISDILQGNPITALVLAEQIINGVSIIWNLDGKQRCTNVYSYVHDGFKVNKSVRRNIIKYQANSRDENGKIILKDGFPVKEWKEFDIVNKKFSQLPEELQDKILNYNFEATLFLNSSSEEIIYNIARYNEGKPMNKTQKGIIDLGEDFAIRVKEISNSDFFIEHGVYNIKDAKNGNINRAIAETVMIENFVNDWNKNAVYEYLHDNATEEMFDTVSDEIDALNEIVDEETDQLFTIKDSFVWFAAFHNAMESGISEDDFKKFLHHCIDEKFRKIEHNGDSLESLDKDRDTKDKKTIIRKLQLIETLLNEMLLENVA